MGDARAQQAVSSNAVKLSRYVAALAAGGCVLGVAAQARAYDAEVEASSAAQWYTLTSPYGDPTVRRRRYTQTLGLSVVGLADRDRPYDPDLTFRARLRMDADLGQDAVERNPASERYIPGLQQTPFDVMYAYLEGRNYLGGPLGFKLGRQYVIDPLGWWSFDGALVSVTTPAYFAVEALAGYEQRGGLPLSSQRFEADGVWRGDRDKLQTAQHLSYLAESRLAPAYGVSAYATGLHWLHARLAYRKVLNRDLVTLPQYQDRGGGWTQLGGTRVSTERFGAMAGVSHEKLGSAEGTFVYDLYSQRVSEVAGRLDSFVTESVTLGVDYDYFVPTFDADSIWNWFAHEGMTTIVGRGAWSLDRHLDLAGSGGIRTFRTEGDPGRTATVAPLVEAPALDPATHSMSDALGSLGGRYRWGDGSVAVRGMLETGQRGHRTGGEVTTRKQFEEGLYDALAVVSLYDWNDALRPERSATSLSYVLGGGVTPFTHTRMGLEWEHSTNRLVGQRYRLLALLQISVLP